MSAIYVKRLKEKITNLFFRGGVNVSWNDLYAMRNNFYNFELHQKQVGASEVNVSHALARFFAEYGGAPIESTGYRGHLGASGAIGRAFPSPYQAPQFVGSAPYDGKYQSQIYQPHSYQSQHLVGHY